MAISVALLRGVCSGCASECTVGGGRLQEKSADGGMGVRRCPLFLGLRVEPCLPAAARQTKPEGLTRRFRTARR